MKVIDDTKGMDVKKIAEAKVSSYIFFLIPATIIGYYIYKKWKKE